MAGRSNFTDIVAFLSSIKGDLSNITSPPHFLAAESVVEISTCWTERPSLFVAAARETDPKKRAMLVTKWLIASHRRQFYPGAGTSTGIKKPLNAFLGEVWFGQWTDDVATTKTVTEQVSHHPPVTACYMANDKYKIWGDGYCRVQMTFTGTLNVKQTGHAILHLEAFDEHYLISWPYVKVKGFLSGQLYPELYGTHYIVSSSGYVSEIKCSGKGLFSGTKNSVDAKIYQRNDPNKIGLYRISGCWSAKFDIFDLQTNEKCDEWDPDENPPSTLEEVLPPEQQDPWESRRAWSKVIAALKRGELSVATEEKTKVEEAQRAIRKIDPNYVANWDPLFFSAAQDEQINFERLASAVPGWRIDSDKTKGIWRFDREKWSSVRKPYHRGKRPI